MFNNIIYFIIVLLIFNMNYPESSHDLSPVYSLGMILLCWLIFLGYCRISFYRFLRNQYRRENYDGRLTSEYHNLIMKLSMMSIILFCLDVYLFNIKSWMQIVPLINRFSVLQGAIALGLFMSYLVTVWYHAYPAYLIVFQTRLERKSFIRSNLRLNLPILFPWLMLTLIYDLISLSPWAGPDSLLNRPGGQILFFAFFFRHPGYFHAPINPILVGLQAIWKIRKAR